MRSLSVWITRAQHLEDHLNAIFAMLQVPQGAPERKHPIWTLRTKEQATAFWKAEFEGVRSSEEGELTTLHDGAGNATIKEDVQGKPPAV